MSLEGIYMCSSWGPLSYACKLIYICIFLIRDIFGVRRDHCMTFFFTFSRFLYCVVLGSERIQAQNNAAVLISNKR